MNEVNPLHLLPDCIELLQKLISVPSFSDQEEDAAELWHEWLIRHDVKNVKRFHNNIYALSENFDKSRHTLLLNSHLDTVRPVKSYTKDPFKAEITGDKLFGLGSNDAGASGVSLAASFLALYKKPDLGCNLILAITASEERMGEDGMRAFLPHLKEKGIYPDMAIVGEPTGMQPAIAERGLVVLDGIAKGKAGHAARDEGENAIYKAIQDIERLRNYQFPKTSALLGAIRINVTMISAGTQHNVIPDSCSYVVDVRTTDAYSNEETVGILREIVKNSVLTPRSTRIHPSVIDTSHPLVQAAGLCGLKHFISTTTSDMALMYDIPSVKIGPGKSERSHSADEFVLISEIKEALTTYPTLIKKAGEILKRETNL